MNIWWWTKALTVWLMPLGLALLLVVFALALVRRRPRAARRLLAGTAVALLLLATPWCANGLLNWLAGAFADPLQLPSAQAIVVLGAGKYHAAPEYGGGDTMGEASLVRLRYAAALYRHTGTPVLVTGGSPEGSPVTEAQTMKAALENEWRVPVRWTESAARNTLENARLSHAMLAPQGVTRIYLVTHAWHMPRAQYAFERAGFEVVPAPTGFSTRYELTLLDFLPHAGALRDSTHFFHEVLGLWWYRLK